VVGLLLLLLYHPILLFLQDLPRVVIMNLGQVVCLALLYPPMIFLLELCLEAIQADPLNNNKHHLVCSINKLRLFYKISKSRYPPPDPILIVLVTRLSKCLLLLHLHLLHPHHP
jgi:hypothetical protein